MQDTAQELEAADELLAAMAWQRPFAGLIRQENETKRGRRMGYWCAIFSLAWRDTRRATKTDTVEAIVVLLLGQVVLGALIWYLTDEATLWVRIATAATPFAVAVLIFGIKLVAAPKVLAEETEQALSVLRRRADQKDRKRAAKDALGSFMNEGNNSFRDSRERDVETEALEWATRCRDFIRETFGSGEAALLLDDSGYTFFSGGSAGGRMRSFIDGRMRRLGELLPRVDQMDLRADLETPTSDLY